MPRATPYGHVRTRKNGLAHAASGHRGSGYVTTPHGSDPYELVRRGSAIPAEGAPTPPSSTPVPPTPASSSTSTGSPPAPATNPYDIEADPVLQQVKAAAAAADSAAQGSALAARQQALLAYGDPALAAKVLGANDPTAAAAGKNQESTLARLKRGYDQNLWSLDNTMDPSLVYSGARIKGEGQLGQTYQGNLADAAAAIQSALGGISDNLNSALGASRDKIAGAYGDAYNRYLQGALSASPPANLAAVAAGG